MPKGWDPSYTVSDYRPLQSARPVVYAETNPFALLRSDLLDPLYTDKRFAYGDQSIYIASGHRCTQDRSGNIYVDGANYVYTDRLQQWYGPKCDDAWKDAITRGYAHNTAACIEAYIQVLLSAPNLRLVHILTGVSRSSMSPYRAYGYIRMPLDRDTA